MSDAGITTEGSPSDPNNKDRHEPRGRKPNDHLPPSRAREVQRAFRLRRAEHLASLEERINQLETENSQLRACLNLPDADRQRIGSGPTGRGKSLKEGGVPMSERVRARKEARERERRAKGLMEPESSEHSDRARDSETLSPRAVSGGQSNQRPPDHSLSLFGNTADHNSFNYNMSMPFGLPTDSSASFPDFSTSLDSSSLFKSSSGNTPNFSNMFNMFDNPAPPAENPRSHPTHHNSVDRRSPISPPLTNPSVGGGGQASPGQPELLTRLKSCCHLSDSHVVNDPGLLIFATRLCQSFPCSFGAIHPNPIATSDAEHLVLEDSWKALKAQLDPGGEADGEHRINTGRMAAELVCRAAASRGHGDWILCRYREGMSIKRSMVAQLIQGLGGKFD